MRIIIIHRTFLLLAGLLLSLHSLVPHIHGSEDVTEVTVKTTGTLDENGNWLNFLQDFFTQTDMGEDHLEHFSPGQDLSLELDLIASVPPVILPTIVLAPPAENVFIRRNRVFRSWCFPPASIYPDADATRGPPSYV